MRPIRATFAALLVILLLSIAGAPAALAQSQSLYWERYDVDIVIEPEEGDLLVTETQVINFTSGVFREGFAELSATNTDGLEDVVVSENGQAYDRVSPTSGSLDEGEYFADELDDGNVEVVWGMGRTQNETRTFEISYRVNGAIRRYEVGNEFQWQAISPGLHDFPIEASTMVVRAPEGAAITDFGYLGPPEFEGVAMDLQLSEDGLTATYTSQEVIQPFHGVSLWAQLPPNSLGGAAPTWQAAFDAQSDWENLYKPWVDIGLLALGLLILAGGPVLLYLLWHLRGRDPQVDAVPEYITAPPADLPPGIAGVLVDEQADNQDIMATIMDLARRGYLVIEESSESSPNRLVSKEFTFRKTDQTGGLNEFETRLYGALFAGGKEVVPMRDLNQRFYANLPGLQKALYDTAVTGGYFTASPEAVRSSYGCMGWAALIGAVLLGCGALTFFVGLSGTALCPALALVVVAIALLALGRHMPAKTRKGAEAAALSRAFKTYLSNLEKYADPKQVTDQFEKYLPFAIAFGLEKSWINRFKQIPTTPMPGWYFPVGRAYPGRVGGLPRTGTLPTGGTLGGAGGGLAGAGSLGTPEVPTLQGMSDSLSGGLQGMSDGLNNMLNSAARSITSTPPSPSGSNGGRSYSGRSGGSFSSGRRSGGSFGGGRSGGGGFRSSGGSGGGRRGFR